MPIQKREIAGAIHTILVGRVTDEELLAYYAQPLFREHSGQWRELVDDRLMSEMAITPRGQQRLVPVMSANAAHLRGGRVAMVASSDLAFGMFRMWELQRDYLDYAVQVFREIGPALEWLGEVRVDQPAD